MSKFIVEDNVELLPFLQQVMPETSRTKLKEVLAHNVYVNGRRVTQFNYPLMKGMEVEIQKSGGRGFRLHDLDIVFEDEHLFVVNKHEGLLSSSRHPADKTVITELNRYLETRHQRCHAHVVHRLDRDTSGLLLVAKSKQVARQFEENWKERVYDRAYVAVAWGRVEQDSGMIRSWLTDGEFCVLSSPTDNGGKEAVTHYRVVRRSRRYSMLELKLDTGRRNQIRVHLREMKHPVVHDPMYGYKEDISPINRLALHAMRLCFVHPVTGRRMQFETPVPQSFEKLMEI